MSLSDADKKVIEEVVIGLVRDPDHESHYMSKLEVLKRGRSLTDVRRINKQYAEALKVALKMKEEI